MAEVWSIHDSWSCDFPRICRIASLLELIPDFGLSKLTAHQGSLAQKKRGQTWDQDLLLKWFEFQTERSIIRSCQCKECNQRAWLSSFTPTAVYCSILQSQRTIPGFVWREGARFSDVLTLSMAGDSHASAQPLRRCPAKSSPARVQATASGCRSTRGQVEFHGSNNDQ